jgi:modulator of FtsH protease HflC
MTIAKNIIGFAIAGILLLFYMSYFVVNEKQKALVLRFGDINRIVEEPGLYFKMPFADTVTTIEDRVIVLEMNNRPVQDIASQVYTVDALTLVRIKDARRFRETLGADMDQARLRVAARMDSALRQTYGRRSFDAALSSDRAVMMREIRDQLRPEADQLGLEIVDVRVRRTDLSDNVLAQTYARMESERNAIAADIRSKGQATKTQRNAETDRAYTVKLAEARRQSEVLRGEGDAERNKIYADAYQKDAEFFGFYRSMQAYSRSLNAEGTTMVLDPKSEFFKYFGSQKDSSQVPTATLPQ